MQSSPTDIPRQGQLIAIEGVTGVGKTYLAHRVRRCLDPNRFVFLDAFTERATRTDLGSQIVRALIKAAHGDPFLQAGHPGSETLLLLATQAHNFETSLAARQEGQTIVEGRSLHSVAAYQAVLLHPRSAATSHAEAQKILRLATRWRPLSDLVILLDDDTDAALYRAEHRDQRRFAPQERATHHRAANLYRRLAADDRQRCRIIDRRATDTTTTVQQLASCLTSTAPAA